MVLLLINCSITLAVRSYRSTIAIILFYSLFSPQLTTYLNGTFPFGGGLYIVQFSCHILFPLHNFKVLLINYHTKKGLQKVEDEESGPVSLHIVVPHHHLQQFCLQILEWRPIHCGTFMNLSTTFHGESKSWKWSIKFQGVVFNLISRSKQNPAEAAQLRRFYKTKAC